MRVPLIHPTDECQVPDLAAVPVPPRPAAPSGRRVHAPAVLAFLRGIDAADTTPAGLGMRRSVAPQPRSRPLPGIATIAYLSAVSVAIQDDYVRHLDTLRILDEISAAAPDQHTLTMLLAPIAAELAPFADAVKAQVAP